MTQPALRPVGEADPDAVGTPPAVVRPRPGPDFHPAGTPLPTGSAVESPTPAGPRPRPPEARWRRPGRLSLRTRLTVLTAVAVGVAVALAALTSFVVLRSQLYRELDTSLLRSAQLAAPANSGPSLVALAAITSGTTDFKLAVIGRTASGTQELSSTTRDTAALVTGVEKSVAEGRAATTLRSARVDGAEYRVAAVPIPNESGSALVFARSLADTQETLRAFALVLGAIGLGGVALAGMLGYSVARAGLRPVTDLTTEAERVARTTRLDPLVIPPARRHDEIARLADAFNGMLRAIAQSRDRERRLVADAGHELRTPLTSMRTNLDLLLQVDRLEGDRLEGGRLEGGRDRSGPAPEPLLPAAERSEMLADLRAQAEELSGLVDDLVQLAREQDDRAVEVDVDLADVVLRAVDRVRRRAPGLAFDTGVEPWSLRGNPALLERAVVNVLDNAAKWSPAGATVAVELKRGVVRVTDAGPGIAPADLPHVFDRFFRSDTARSTPGTGLGLSIVRQVVEQHGGSVRAERAPGGGARFFLVLPGSG